MQVLQQFWDLYPTYNMIYIMDKIKKDNNLSNDNNNKELLNTIQSICWAPRFINHSEFSKEYKNSLLTQYLYGNYMKESVKELFKKYKSKISFTDLFNKFIKRRHKWNVIINIHNKITIEPRSLITYTYVQGRYNDCNQYLDELLNSIDTKYITTSKELNSIEITLTYNNISHKCIKRNNIWIWQCDDNIDKIKILNELFSKSLTNHSYFPSFYYSFISLSYLIRGTSSIGEMFRLYFQLLRDENNDNLIPVKPNIIALDTYALSTQGKDFVKNWNFLFDTLNENF